MKGKTAIARRSVGGQHVVLRAYSNNELKANPANVTPKTFNDFVLARNFDQLMSAIDALGVMSRDRFGQPSAKSFFELGEERERVRGVSEVKEAFKSGELVGMDHERLVDEAYLELVGNDVVNKSALRRLCEGYDATKNGFLEQLEEFDDCDEVSIEPLQDWMDLRNNIVIAARVMSFVINPPEIEGRDVSALSDNPLKAAGFTLDSLSRGAFGKIANSYACFDEYDAQYRRLCSFNTYFARNADTPVSDARDHFLSLAYQAPLLMSRLDGGGWSTALKHGHSVNYLSAPIATNYAESKNVKQNYLCACFNKGEEPREVAMRFVRQMMWGWMNPSVDDEALFDRQGTAKIKVDSLITALWNEVFFPGDNELAICKNCGNVFLRPRKGRTKIWCRDSCRVQYSAKGGPDPWLENALER